MERPASTNNTLDTVSVKENIFDNELVHENTLLGLFFVAQSLW